MTDTKSMEEKRETEGGCMGGRERGKGGYVGREGEGGKGMGRGWLTISCTDGFFLPLDVHAKWFRTESTGTFQYCHMLIGMNVQDWNCVVRRSQGVVTAIPAVLTPATGIKI